MQPTLIEPEFDPQKPYNDLPALPPAVEVETRRTLKAAIRARAALADLKGVGRLIPNQGMLVRALILQEARLSSEVENIVTTSDALYQALSRDEWEEHPHIKEVLRYGDALWHGVGMIRQGRILTANIFCEIATILKDAVIGVRDLPGTRIVNPVTHEIVYSPPEGADLIRGKLDNLISFHYNETEVDPLIKMAICHYQFEAIHPFRDGNGRTGRVLNLLWLVEQGLLDQPVLYMSKTILENKSAYYTGLRGVTEERNWEGWIEYMLGVVEVTAKDTQRRVEQIHDAMREAGEKLKAAYPKVYSRDLLELIFSQPYTRIAFLEKANIAKRQAASEYLRKVEDVGILTSMKSGRHTLYLNPTLMRLLSA